MIKIYRIVCGNSRLICGVKDLYGNTSETGLYQNFSRINHSCVPNAITSWVMGDFKRIQVRAMMPIEQGQEILINYSNMMVELDFGSREFRRQHLLDTYGFLCHCSECSLGGEELEENERIRVKLRQKKDGMDQLLASNLGDLKKLMKLAHQRVNMMKKLNLRTGYVGAMICFYKLSVQARSMNIPCAREPDTYKQEAWKYAEMFGDRTIHVYKSILGN